jgi:tetratricopeptide (TPR) repeat protein
VEINPKYSDAYNNMGNVLLEQGLLDEALTSYRTALEVNPKFYKAYNNIAIVLKAQG